MICFYCDKHLFNYQEWKKHHCFYCTLCQKSFDRRYNFERHLDHHPEKTVSSHTTSYPPTLRQWTSFFSHLLSKIDRSTTLADEKDFSVFVEWYINLLLNHGLHHSDDHTLLIDHLFQLLYFIPPEFLTLLSPVRHFLPHMLDILKHKIRSFHDSGISIENQYYTTDTLLSSKVFLS